MSDGIKTVAIFGATGSVGTSTLDLIAQFPTRFKPIILTGGSNANRLAELALAYRPEHIAIADETALAALKENLSGTKIAIHAGTKAIAELAKIEADITITAITGMAGLMPSLNAVGRGGVIGLANKEALVAAGRVLLAEAEASGAVLVPIDSEHNAIHQIIAQGNTTGIDSIILTASGGPFWDWGLEAMATATPAQAVRHPIWPMGAKISVDSATMMNKGLEVIEASVLFALPPAQIKTVIHRQSLVHGIVCYRDGSMLAQLAGADMRVPISYCLAWPDRLDWHAQPMDYTALQQLRFDPPDDARFPCLNLAYQAMEMGGLAPTALNAANEVAVEAFLAERIGFLDIARLNRYILEGFTHGTGGGSLEAVLAYDRKIRAESANWLQREA